MQPIARDFQIAFAPQQLETYEEDLGFRPEWVDIDEALRRNRLVLQRGDPSIPRWVERETFVLQALRENLD